MLQVLIFAPYVALAASVLLAGTVAMICCLPRYDEAAPAAGFTPRAHQRAVMSEGSAIYSAPRSGSRSSKKSAVLAAAA